MRTSKIQNGHHGPQNGWRGLERFLGAPVISGSIKFFDPSTHSMRKVDDGEKKEKKGKKKKIMAFIVATNVIASLPPERRPTGTPHARAKIMTFIVATNVVASRPTERRPTGMPHACANFHRRNCIIVFVT